MDREMNPQPVALPALAVDDDPEAPRCARCRLPIDDEPAGEPQGRRDRTWCRPCEAILYPRRVRSTAVLTLVPPLDTDA